MTMGEHNGNLPDEQVPDSHLEALTMKIVAAAGPELARRQRENPEDETIWVVLGRWSKPVLSAAALVVVVSASVLGLSSTDDVDIEDPTFTMAEALLPEDVAPWYYPGNELTLAAMVSALEGGYQ